MMEWVNSGSEGSRGRPPRSTSDRPQVLRGSKPKDWCCLYDPLPGYEGW